MATQTVQTITTTATPAKRARTDDIKMESGPLLVQNYVGGEFVECHSGQYLDVRSPLTNEVIGRVALSDEEDVKRAVAAAEAGFKVWSAWTVKQRAQVLIRFHQLMIKHTEELVDLIMLEHGKNRVEAAGDVSKGNETVEYSISMPQLIGGRILEVSSGVTCSEVRRPLGVVASIVPFNFPAMVPLWTLPIAIATGNALIVKPSEKVPLTCRRMMELLTEAGLPKGVVNTVNGTAAAVNGIIDHPAVKAITFVGSTRVAELVAKRARGLNKKVLALGGAKNHLVTMPDCNVTMAAQDIVNSFTGCTGQRCMAASVLLTVGDQPELLKQIVDKAGQLTRGRENRQLGPVIDQMALDRIHKYIAESERRGAKILLDGRPWTKQNHPGFWIGPTVILHNDPQDPALHEEIFGPVLSIWKCENKEEAVAFENANPHGNAAAVYTNTGENAEWFCARFTAAMLGVNVGVPVPREPFSFGGMGASKFGDMDITGDGGIEFFTQRIKTTTKWNPPEKRTWMD